MSEDSPRFGCDARFPSRRVVRLIEERIAHSHFDLTGLTVLTEAAAGYGGPGLRGCVAGERGTDRMASLILDAQVHVGVWDDPVLGHTSTTVRQLDEALAVLGIRGAVVTTSDRRGNASLLGETEQDAKLCY